MVHSAELLEARVDKRLLLLGRWDFVEAGILLPGPFGSITCEAEGVLTSATRQTAAFFDPELTSAKLVGIGNLGVVLFDQIHKLVSESVWCGPQWMVQSQQPGHGRSRGRKPPHSHFVIFVT